MNLDIDVIYQGKKYEYPVSDLIDEVIEDLKNSISIFAEEINKYKGTMLINTYEKGLEINFEGFPPELEQKLEKHLQDF